MAQKLFSHSTLLPVSPVETWAALQNPDTWGAIGGVDDIGSVHKSPDGRLSAFTFSATVAGLRYPGRASVDHVREPHEMDLEISTSELLGTIAVRVAPSHAPDRLDVTLHVRSRSLIAGMMFTAIAGAIGNGFPERVEAFAAALDASA